MMPRRTPGKKIGSCIYVHERYAKEAGVPFALINTAGCLAAFHYQCIKYDKKTHTITLQHSPNFCDAHEPWVGTCVRYRDGDDHVSVTPPRSDPMVWHHKWMWVADDFSGFDVAAAKERSSSYEHRLDAHLRRRMGRKSYWDMLLRKWGLPI